MTSPSPVEPAPTLAVGTDNETSVPKTSPPPKLQTRSESRFDSFVIPSILEPPMEDDSEPEGSLTGPMVAKDRAASSLAKGPASKGPPKTADRRRGQPSVADWPNLDIRAYTLPGAQATQEFNGTSSRTKSCASIDSQGHRAPETSARRTMR